jgi:E3 ubiquitin-protein ligase SIAH1
MPNCFPLLFFFFLQIGFLPVGLQMSAVTYIDDSHAEVIYPPKNEEMLDVTELVGDHIHHSPKPNVTSYGNVRDLLECPVCLSAMYPPIHQVQILTEVQL